MNKVVIVTGASKGIGKEIAKGLAKKGYQVIANYNKSEKEILELKKELEKEKRRSKRISRIYYEKI